MSSLKNTYLLSLASSLGSISAACFVAGGGCCFTSMCLAPTFEREALKIKWMMVVLRLKYSKLIFDCFIVVIQCLPVEELVAFSSH